MPLLTLIEAAITLGVEVELIEYFISHCPKHGQNHKLPAKKIDEQTLIDEKDLLDYQRYLNQPWPKPPSGQRPTIPENIKHDVRMESHLACAICGHMDNGEVAHIDAVADTLNNSPDNLIYLCPNHHTKYDLGYKPASNVTPELVRMAKNWKRKSRQRMLAYEANAVKGLHGLLQLVKSISKQLKDIQSQDEADVLTTEVQKLLELVPQLTVAAQEQAQRDQPESDVDKLVAKNAPTFARLASDVMTAQSQRDVRRVMESVANKSHELLLEFDEVDCPHCGGRGMTGLVGDLCTYCKGSCLVTQDEAAEYSPAEIDEVECPHCNGRGTTGLTQILCKFCHGSCVVTKEEAEDYDPGEIDETECPHCNGQGTIGCNHKLCHYCGGDCVVSKQEKEEYDRDTIDEVDCPHCNGRGWKGYREKTCAFCHGDSVMTKAEADEYDPDKIDEVDCPNCNGQGVIGWNQVTCKYCRGDSFVTAKEKEEFDPEDIDQVECPKCHGSGTYGFAGDQCKLCKGDSVVPKELREAYINKYGRD